MNNTKNLIIKDILSLYKFLKDKSYEPSILFYDLFQNSTENKIATSLFEANKCECDIYNLCKNYNCDLIQMQNYLFNIRDSIGNYLKNKYDYYKKEYRIYENTIICEDDYLRPTYINKEIIEYINIIKDACENDDDEIKILLNHKYVNNLTKDIIIKIINRFNKSYTYFKKEKIMINLIKDDLKIDYETFFNITKTIADIIRNKEVYKNLFNNFDINEQENNILYLKISDNKKNMSVKVGNNKEITYDCCPIQFIKDIPNALNAYFNDKDISIPNEWITEPLTKCINTCNDCN